MSAATETDAPLSPHERCVVEWLARSGASGGTSRDEHLATLFLIGLRAIWQRALPSLGAIMLTTIFERILARAEVRYAGLTRVGLRVHARSSIEMLAPAAPTTDLADAVRFTLTELLDVLDQLTAQALTPALHSALRNAPCEAPIV